MEQGARVISSGKRPDAIHIGDWHRLLVGQAPWSFVAEIVFRAVITYVVLLVAMRLMGKRIGAQLTQTELAVVVTLGAIVRYSSDARHELR